MLTNSIHLCLLNIELGPAFCFCLRLQLCRKPYRRVVYGTKVPVGDLDDVLVSNKTCCKRGSSDHGVVATSAANDNLPFVGQAAHGLENFFLLRFHLGQAHGPA